MLKEYVKPEFVVLVPALYLVGRGLKKERAGGGVYGSGAGGACCGGERVREPGGEAGEEVRDM